MAWPCRRMAALWLAAVLLRSAASFIDPGAGGMVLALSAQADGKILVGGAFPSIGCKLRANFARLNSDGTVDDSLNPGANSAVTSLAAQSDGKILLGGALSLLD